MGVTAWDPHRNYPNFQPQQPPPQTVVAPQHKPKRASCAIQIKDPETGQAIDPTSDDKPSSRTVSESQKDEVSEAAPAPTVVATAVEEEKKITVEEKVQQEQASENVAVAENKQAAADDNDGWEVPKTKKGKGAKKTDNVKGDKNNGKKNTREQSKEQPKKKVIKIMLSNRDHFFLSICVEIFENKNFQEKEIEKK